MTTPNKEYLKFEDVAIEHRVPVTKIGRYNRMVYICPECDNDMRETNFEFAVGFASVPPAVVMVVECDKCGDRYHSHASASTYRTFLQAQKRPHIRGACQIHQNEGSDPCGK